MISRITLVESLELLENKTHTELDRFALKYGLEDYLIGSSKSDRINNLVDFFIKENLPKEEKESLLFEVVKDIIDNELESINRLRDYRGVEKSFEEKHSKLFYSLNKDGFSIENNQLRKKLPNNKTFAEDESEVERILTKYSLTTLKRHLAQAIDNYHKANWEASNAQQRAFFEGLFNEIADLIDPVESAKHTSSNAKRNMLAQMENPILYSDLNEVTGDGKNFINGVFKRIHRKGAHPGLSDQEDCTFRLNIVFLVSAEVLRRFEVHMENFHEQDDFPF